MRCAICVSVCVALACGAGPAGSLEARFETLKRADELTLAFPARVKAAVVGATYDVLFASDPAMRRVRELSPRDLELLYKAVSLTVFYTADDRQVHAMPPVLVELEARGLASAQHYTRMYEAFVTARMIPQARALASEHPLLALDPLPELHDAELVAGQPTAWVVAPDRRALERRSIDLRHAARVVVVSHPTCHFWANARQALQDDPVLGEIFAAHAIQLAPQEGRIDFDLLQVSNREHPAWQTVLTYRRDEWPMIDVWSTPTFYFFQAGTLVAKVEGWPEGGRRAEVVAALEQIGLLPTRPRP
jgi:hypothetical protein